MPPASVPQVTALYRYPVKGLSAQSAPSFRIRADKPISFDRVFALVRPGSPVTRESPHWAKKGRFVMLMLDEALATIRTHVDDDLVLTAREGDREVLRADLSTDAGRTDVETLVFRLVPSLGAPPVMVRSPDGHFMDKPDSVISLINLATVRALESEWNVRVDPLRFRANVYIDGLEAWSEFDWVGKGLRLGRAEFRVDRRNGRCGATNVDPATGRRDLDIPGSLRKTFGHKDVGVYLVARSDADVAVGDVVEPIPATAESSASEAAPFASPNAGAFICRGCYYVYDESRGVAQNNIPPGTRFVELPAEWRCPDCGTDKSSFRQY